MSTLLRTIKTFSPTILLVVFVAILVASPLLSAAQDADMTEPMSFMERIAWTVIVQFTGWLVWAAGTVLDYAIQNFVIGFGQFFTTHGVGVAVDNLWVIVRDFFNILFIFGLVYIGFKMILNSDDSRTRSTLVTLIMAALLVNFSLFITKFVVDFTNILATEIACEGFVHADAAGVELDCRDANASVRMADTFFGYMGIQTNLTAPTDILNGQGNQWGYIFGVGLVNVIATFAFLSGGIMIIIRFIALSIFMVLSPFMFIGWVFPGFSNTTSKYWSGFLGRAFYAPVFIVLLFFAASILSIATSAGAPSFDSLRGGVTTNSIPLAQTLASFILSAGFLIAAVQVAGKLSADGASQTMKAGTTIVRGGQRRVKNAAVWTARNPYVQTGAGFMAGGALGAAGVAAYRNRRRIGNAGLAGIRGVGGAVNRKTLNPAAEKLRKGLDAKNAERAQGGKWSKAAARLSDRTVGSALDRAANTNVKGSETAAERRERAAKQNAKLNTKKDENDRSSVTKESLATINKLKELIKSGTTLSDDQKAALASARGKLGIVGKMSNEEILKLDHDTLKDEEFAKNMTDAHIKAVKESGIYTIDEGKEIAQANINGTQRKFAETLDDVDASAEELNNTLDQLAHTMQRMPTDKLLDLGADSSKTGPNDPPQWLLNERVASNLSEKQLEEMQNSGRFSSTQMTDIRAAKTRGLEGIVDGANTSAVGPDMSGKIIAAGNSNREDVFKTRTEKMFQGSSKAAGQLPPSIFSASNMAEFITPTALAERDRNGLSATEVAAIQTNIESLETLNKAKYDRWVGWSSSTAGQQTRFNFT